MLPIDHGDDENNEDQQAHQFPIYIKGKAWAVQHQISQNSTQYLKIKKKKKTKYATKNLLFIQKVFKKIKNTGSQ